MTTGSQVASGKTLVAHLCPSVIVLALVGAANHACHGAEACLGAATLTPYSPPVRLQQAGKETRADDIPGPRKMVSPLMKLSWKIHLPESS